MRLHLAILGLLMEEQLKASRSPAPEPDLLEPVAEPVAPAPEPDFGDTDWSAYDFGHSGPPNRAQRRAMKRGKR